MAGGINPSDAIEGTARSITIPVLFDPNGGKIINTDQIVAAPRPPARLRAHAEVYFNGRNITDTLDPHLLSIRITDKKEGVSTASLVIDDRYARWPLPGDGAKCYIKLGWPDQQGQRVFNGVLADIMSLGSRRGGRSINVEFQSADLTSGLKESVSGTWGKGRDAAGSEGVPFSKVAEEIAKKAGVTLKIGGALGDVKRKFWMIDKESPMSFLQRTAKELGGALKIEGTEASIVDLAGNATAGGQDFEQLQATVGVNVLAWAIKPTIGRTQWANTAHGFFDRDKANWLSEVAKVPGGQGFGNAKARHMGLFPVNEEAMAKTLGTSDAAVSVRERGSGWIVLDGEPKLQALGRLLIGGARPGVDGDYRVVEVEHTYFRGGGFISRGDVNNPQLLTTADVTGKWKNTP